MTSSSPQEVTRLLAELQSGRAEAGERLAQLVYGELHVLAVHALRKESPGHTLQPTELVDEAFMRLLGQRSMQWRNRAHFYGIAAQAIRRILLDHARRRKAAKRDHGVRVTLEDSAAQAPEQSIDLIALDQALEKLAALDPRQARVVELRFFGGLEIEEMAQLLEVSPATIKRDWTFARAFLQRELEGAAS